MSSSVYRKLTIGRLCIAYSRRSKDELWGRFGGGWNWKLGLQAGYTTLVINLLICSITIAILQRPKA